MNKHLEINRDENETFSLSEGGRVISIEIPTHDEAIGLVYMIRRSDASGCDTTQKLAESDRFIDAGGMYLRSLDEIYFRGLTGKQAIKAYFGV